MRASLLWNAASRGRTESRGAARLRRLKGDAVMARVEDRVQPGQPGDGIAQEIPSKNLPPVPYRDLPEPLPLKKIVGASVILLATSIGSGEFVLWPFIASQVGLVAMWAALVGITIQYFINMEIERYTLATGETAVTGFT